MDHSGLISRYDPPLFRGDSYDPEHDEKRLMRQLDLVRLHLLTGERWTLRRLADKVGCSEASASARIRDVRREGLGGAWQVHKDRRFGGVWEYFVTFGKEMLAGE